MTTEQTIIQLLPQLGVGITAVLALVYTVRLLSDNHRKEMQEAREERKKAQEVFIEFVNSNNHTMNELVKSSTAAIQESTEAIKASRRAIEESGKYIQEATQTLVVVNDKILNGKK